MRLLFRCWSGCGSGWDLHLVLLVAGGGGEDMSGRVQVDGGVVDSGGHLPEADRDQPHLAVVLGDVTGCEDTVDVGAHSRVDEHVSVALELESPLAQRAEVRGE